MNNPVRGCRAEGTDRNTSLQNLKNKEHLKKSFAKSTFPQHFLLYLIYDDNEEEEEESDFFTPGDKGWPDLQWHQR